MGKSVPSPTRLKEFVRVATKKLNYSKPNLKENPFHNQETTTTTTSISGGGGGGSGLKLKKMENPQNRMPLSEVVTDCSKRWFQEAGGETPRFYNPETSTSGGGGGGGLIGGDSDKFKLKMENLQTMNRMPLSEVVSDCAKRWFQDTLKEAKAGDISMQVLVGQMYFSGYGVTSDDQKGRAWITRASRKRSSVWKVSDKRPGYNASDSDSDDDELKDDVK